MRQVWRLLLTRLASGVEFWIKMFTIYSKISLIMSESNGEDVFGDPENSDEIDNLVNATYNWLDEDTPTGRRTPEGIRNIENFRKELKKDVDDIELEKRENEINRMSWQAYSDRKRKQNENLNKDEIKRFHSNQKTQEILQLNKALENPKVKDLLFKVITQRISPQANPDLKEIMMSLTLNGTGNKGGKSRVFRRKNKKRHLHPDETRDAHKDAENHLRVEAPESKYE